MVTNPMNVAPPLPNSRHSMISDSAKITLTDDQLAATIGEEVVLIGLKKGTYYGLEDVAAHIWRHLHSARTFVELVDEVVRVFDGERDDIVRDVSEFIRALEAEGLANISISQAIQQGQL